MGSPSFSDVRMLSSQVGVALLLCFLCTVSAENARKPKILFGSISSSTATTTSTVTTATASYCYTIKATITTACGKRKKRFIDDMGETELALKPSSASNPQVDLDASVRRRNTDWTFVLNVHQHFDGICDCNNHHHLIHGYTDHFRAVCPRFLVCVRLKLSTHTGN